MKKTNPAFLNGVPELLVLQLLSRREMYGYQIVEEIRTRPGKPCPLARAVSTPTCIIWRRKGW